MLIRFCVKDVRNGSDKWGVTFVVLELKVELILQTKLYVQNITTIAHCKYDFD